MNNSATIEYFGKDAVERAVAAFFGQHGLNEDVRETLMFLAVHREDDFFQIVEDYLERKSHEEK